jgi:BsuBI/PstI restriction endonuclease domain/BsuBI/PstI restriction endonuclease HTH domain
MAAHKKIEGLVEQALEILGLFGIPVDSLTDRRKTKMAKAFLAVAGMKPGMAWADAKDNNSGHRLRSRQIIASMNKHLGENIADSSYDDIQRKDLVLPVAAHLVLNSAGNPEANTNDGTRGFALSPEAADVVRKYGTPFWDSALCSFLGNKPTLAQQLQRKRNLARVDVVLPNGISLNFSPGGHNLLQKKIIEDFLPLFGFGAEILYVGDSSNKLLYCNEDRLRELHFFELAHDKLPDIVAYSARKNWLFLIEAVYTGGPISEMRRRTLTPLTSNCTVDVVYVTAFPDRRTYRKHASEIAWETEVWIADAPEHMIHFNGDKFLGPHSRVAIL